MFCYEILRVQGTHTHSVPPVLGSSGALGAGGRGVAFRPPRIWSTKQNTYIKTYKNLYKNIYLLSLSLSLLEAGRWAVRGGQWAIGSGRWDV